MGVAIHLQQLRVPHTSKEGQRLKDQGAILDFTCQTYDTN